MTHWFDRLARASISNEHEKLDRRSTLKLAGALLLGASPVGRALAAAGPTAIPAVTGPGADCLSECRGRNRQTYFHNLAGCTQNRRLYVPFQGIAAFACGWEAVYRGWEGKGNCTRLCQPPPTPTPVPVSNPGVGVAPGTGGCPSGTSQCATSITCCAGSDLCCPCQASSTGWICCIPQIGCTCC